jgi:hypothetical protein
VGQAAVHQGLVQAFVGLLEIDILADDADFHLILGVFEALHQLLPGLQTGRPGPDVQDLDQALVQTLLMEQQGNLVDVFHVLGGDHRLGLDVAEQGDFGLDVGDRSRSLRHNRTSGWIPMLRSSLTLCWVGLVLTSPAVLM